MWKICTGSVELNSVRVKKEALEKQRGEYDMYVHSTEFIKWDIIEEVTSHSLMFSPGHYLLNAGDYLRLHLEAILKRGHFEKNGQNS